MGNIPIEERRLHGFIVDDNEGSRWIVAEDEADALSVVFDGVFDSVDDYREDCTPVVTKLDDTKVLAVTLIDEPREPVVTKTVAEWCRGGRGVVAITER